MSEEKEQIRFGPKLAWALTLAFAVLISLTPILRNVTADWKPAAEFYQASSPEATNHLAQKRSSDPRITREKPSFIDHREAWEKELDDSPLADSPRRVIQQLLTGTVREGNRNVVIGRDGWLFYRPAIDALTGYGPLKSEPDSVAKDPTRPKWSGPRDAILEFHKQLSEFGVELVLVPIPVKPMVYPEMLGCDPAAGPLRHPDAAKFFGELNAEGIEVIDLTDELFTRKRDGEIFLKQDTHWTPLGMEIAADVVARHVQSKPWFESLEVRKFESSIANSAHTGDLVDKLDLPKKTFEQEFARYEQLLAPEIRDQDSPVVLLGDSFTNIFSAAAMNWGERGGFAENLSAKLGIPIDTIAQNGQASTGVRQTLANRRGSAHQMREKKKIVIWAIAARDLFLSESIARETRLEWKRVAFNDSEPPRELPSGAIVIEAEMTARHPLRDPSTVDYPSVIYAAKYRVLKVLDGEFKEDEVLVNLWGFRDKKFLPSAKFQLGDRQILTLVPFGQKDEIQSITRINDFPDAFLFDTEFWVEEARPIE
ncbi:MAG: hypothetical protein ACI8UO_000814 [Verrucomicrobiales bacterium]|jgi:hypothetical protein